MKPIQVTPNVQLCVMIVFAVGVIASFLLIIAALVAAAYILNLAMVTIGELATSIATLYNGSDSVVKLLLICIIGYLLARLVRSAYYALTHAHGGTYGN